MNELWNHIEFDELANKVEKRLDEIFEEIVHEPEEQRQSENDLILVHLNKLNKILLSIESEDAAKQIVEVLKQLESIEKIYKEEKYVMILIRLQINLCNYIKTHKKDAHPLSVKLLRSFFNNMCDIVYAENITIADTKQIINKEIRRYKKLLELIKNRQYSKKQNDVASLSKRAPIILESPKAMDPQKAQFFNTNSIEMRRFFETIISDIKDFMRKELEELKTELQAGFINK